MSYHDDIARCLARMEKLVESAKRENKQGWIIQEDLERMRRVLDELDAYTGLVAEEHGPVDTGDVHE